jgi:hypothetical protein
MQYPSYYSLPEEGTFKALLSPEISITVIIKPYCAMIAVSPCDEEDNAAEKIWEPITKTIFQMWHKEAKRRLDTWIPSVTEALAIIK